MSILGEGNTSARIGDDTFWVKASGSQLSNLDENGVVECRFAPLLDLIADESSSDERVDSELLACRVDENGRKPSVEAMFHADLLQLPNVNFVGTHTSDCGQQYFVYE
jgi:rhamnose utilization protein RhaD (predicted bifunctional aldolase and dehydrogenase)